MKTSKATCFKLLALVAALASLLLCSCASTDLLQRQAFLAAQIVDEEDQNLWFVAESPRYQSLKNEMGDVNGQIKQERNESAAMLGMVLQSPVVQGALNRALTRSSLNQLLNYPTANACR